ncbi:MAG: hypothetical protein E7361_03480 [Clostridiales bacterium]|nr:hypothetical protein [Clostridiales bacterium]
MKTKHKVAVISIIAVMAIALIGVSIGLVLVAQQATMNNSMTVSYSANNVDATITASGINYATGEATTGEDIKLSDDTTSKTVEFKATDSAAEVEAKGTDAVSFKDTELTASGEAVYTFSIKNTANASNTSVLKVLATFSNMKEGNEDDNITIKVGPTRATAISAITLDDNIYFAEVGAGQATIQFVVIMNVTDATLNVEDFSLDMDIKLGYDLYAPSINPIVTINNESNKAIKFDGYYDNTIDGTTKTFLVAPYISTESDPMYIYPDVEPGDEFYVPVEDRIDYTGAINWAFGLGTYDESILESRDYDLKIDVIIPGDTTYTATKEKNEYWSGYFAIYTDKSLHNENGGIYNPIDFVSVAGFNLPSTWPKGIQVIITVI